MHKLETLNNPRIAQAFIDYMALKKINIQMKQEEANSYSLYLMDQEHQVETDIELKAFLKDPLHSRYQAASWEAINENQPHFDYGSFQFISLIKAKAGPATLWVMLVCVVVFIFQQTSFFNAVFTKLHFPTTESEWWDIWRWFSPAVMHFSVLHITFNILWWWQFGGMIEKKLGSSVIAIVFLVSALLSNWAQYWVGGDANFGGLSGVVYALFGFLWVFSYKAPQLGLRISKSLIGFMLAWLVIGMIQPIIPIANTAHVVGLLVGIVFGFYQVRGYQETR